MEAPIPLIVSCNGEMRLHEDAVEILEGISSPLSVVSIVGKYRTGKSYIMNRMFNTNSGFQLGETIQSTTKGIWIWIKPHPLNPDINLVLLDTEGLHDVEKGDPAEDMKLFCLTLLLSSCLLYNTVGTLDDIIIKQLHLVTELTEHIKTRADKEEDGTQFSKYFPCLFMVLRDFFLDLSIQGKKCTPNEYMENALKLKQGTGRKINDYNEPRECIRQYFPQRQCFTLCKPTDEDSKLKILDQVSEGDIRQLFLKQIHELVSAVLLKTQGPMTVDGIMINGTEYLDIARVYINNLNKGIIPCISSTVDLLQSNTSRRSVQEALEAFDHVINSELEGNMPHEQEQMETVQKKAYHCAIEMYKSGNIFGKDSYAMQLEAELERKYQDCCTRNRISSQKKCQDLIKTCFKPVSDSVIKGVYLIPGGYSKYTQDKDGAVNQYTRASGKGPMADTVLNEYLESTHTEEESIINADQQLSELDKQKAREHEEYIRQRLMLESKSKQKEQMVNNIIRQQDEHQTFVAKLQSQFNERQQKLLQDEAKHLQEAEIEYKRLLKEGVGKQTEQYKTLLSHIEENRQRQKKEKQALNDYTENYMREHSDLLEELRNNREVDEEHLATMKDKLDNLQKDFGHTPFLMQKYYYDGDDNPSKDFSRWITDLSDDTPLNKLSIPGSHDTMTFECSEVKILGIGIPGVSKALGSIYAQCQAWALSDQLYAGIRFIDIRCCIEKGQIALYHGYINLNKEIKNLVEPVCGFLAKNPGEFLIMRLKDETREAKDFGDILYSNAGLLKSIDHLIWKKSLVESMPTIKDVRGKIILIRDHMESHSCRQNNDFGCRFDDDNTLSISDMCTVTDYNSKWLNVLHNINAAATNDIQRLFVTFTSGNNPPYIWPASIARYINKKLYDNLIERRGDIHCCGIVVMDFPGSSLIEEIINVNRA